MKKKISFAEFRERYHINEKDYLGSGGFAKVYKAFDRERNHYVAIKIVDVKPEWKHFTLDREVEFVNNLPVHRNIVRYISCDRFKSGLAGETDYAVLEYFESGNLEQFLNKNELNDNELRLLVRGILNGVGFLHENNCLHRDMKAQNILLHRENGIWVPKITDFGLSRNIGGDLSVSNSSIGLSYAYAAPEQIQNKKIAKAVDLWAVGVVIYRIVAGELPFKSAKGENGNTLQSELELTRKIINLELPKELDNLQEPYQEMVKRCLVLDPLQRIESAAKLIEILDGKISNAAPPSYTQPATETSYLPPEPVPVVPAEPATTLITKEPATEIIAQPKETVYDEAPAYTAPDYVPPPSDYAEPRHNQTHIFKPDIKTVPPPPVQPVINTGDPRSVSWWWALLPLLVLLGVGIFCFTRGGDAPEQQLVHVNDAILDPTIRTCNYESLSKKNLAAQNDLNQLKAIRAEMEKVAPSCKENYMLIYEIARNDFFQDQFVKNQHEQGFANMQKSAGIAIQGGDASIRELLKVLERDRKGLLRAFSRPGHRSIWSCVKKALQRKDASRLECGAFHHK